MDALTRDRELAERSQQLHIRASRVFADFAIQPRGVIDIPDPTGYRLAFGYLVRHPGGGPRQKYIEIPVSIDEYLSMDAGVQERVLAQLTTELHRITGTSTGAGQPGPGG